MDTIHRYKGSMHWPIHGHWLQRFFQTYLQNRYYYRTIPSVHSVLDLSSPTRLLYENTTNNDRTNIVLHKRYTRVLLGASWKKSDESVYMYVFVRDTRAFFICVEWFGVCVLVSGREALMTSVMHASFAQTRSPQQTHDQPYQVHPQTDSPRHTPTQVDNCIYT